MKIDHDRVCGMKAMIFRPKRCASFSFLSLKLLLNEASYDKIYPMKINQKQSLCMLNVILTRTNLSPED